MAFERIERGIYRQSRSQYLFIDWSAANGKRHRESTKTKSIRKARALRNTRIADAQRGVAVAPDARKVTLADMWQLVANEYVIKQNRSLDRAERGWVHITGSRHISRKAMAIDEAALKKYLAARITEGATHATIRYELSILRLAFNLAVEQKMLPTRPTFPKVKVDNVRAGFLSDTELGVLLLELTEHLRNPTRWAYVTGWRRTEVFGMRWEWVDWDEGVVTLPASMSKNKKARPLAFSANPTLTAILEAQRFARKGPWVFHRNGKPIKYHYGAWRTACRRAGFPGLTFHDLRRSAVRNFERNGVSRSAAMSITGHKTENVYRRYSIVDESVQREALEKMGKASAVAMPSGMP